jgi:hypothetical protein
MPSMLAIYFCLSCRLMVSYRLPKGFDHDESHLDLCHIAIRQARHPPAQLCVLVLAFSACAFHTGWTARAARDRRLLQAYHRGQRTCSLFQGRQSRRPNFESAYSLTSPLHRRSMVASVFYATKGMLQTSLQTLEIVDMQGQLKARRNSSATSEFRTFGEVRLSSGLWSNTHSSTSCSR